MVDMYYVAIYRKLSDLFRTQFCRFLSCSLEIFILTNICLKKYTNRELCILHFNIASEFCNRYHGTHESSTTNGQVQGIYLTALLHFTGKPNTVKQYTIKAFTSEHFLLQVTDIYQAISTHHERNNIISLFFKPKQDTRCIKASTVCQNHRLLVSRHFNITLLYLVRTENDQNASNEWNIPSCPLVVCSLRALQNLCYDWFISTRTLLIG